jgi:hypothetical protein
MTWTQPLGPNAHLRCVRASAMKQEQGATLARIARETNSTIERKDTLGYGWTPEELRGIPAVGRNCAGAIRGTSPHAIRD